MWTAVSVLCLGLIGVASANGPDGAEVFQKAQASAKNLKAITYEATLHTEWSNGDKQRDQTARVTMLRNAPDLPKIRIDAQSRAGDEGGEGATSQPTTSTQIASDGKVVCAISHRERQYRQAEGPRGISLLTPYVGLLIGDLVGETPYAEEIGATGVTYVGTEKVGETECQVIDVRYARSRSTARWYFGTEDYLPRRIERKIVLPMGQMTRVLTLTALDANPTVADNLFHLEIPEGYKQQSATPPLPPTAGGGSRGDLLAVGTEAPDFKLKTPDGQEVHLAELRGKVVLLDFWATWCGPCKRAMPGLQKLQERMKDKPFVLYGVNTFERGGDPAKYMKSQGFTYGLLLKGNATARQYHVKGIPTFYVIGHDGKIVYVGAGGGREAELEAAVQRALSQIK
ncbi:MAG: TlpA disulfide reductase family protein [Phycisphaerae bacterium]